MLCGWSSSPRSRRDHAEIRRDTPRYDLDEPHILCATPVGDAQRHRGAPRRQRCHRGGRKRARHATDKSQGHHVQGRLQRAAAAASTRHGRRRRRRRRWAREPGFIWWCAGVDPRRWRWRRRCGPRWHRRVRVAYAADSTPGRRTQSHKTGAGDAPYVLPNYR